MQQYKNLNNLLVLDFNPRTTLGSDLRGILETALSTDISLHHEPIGSKFSNTSVGDMIHRIAPAVTMVVSQYNPARPLKKIFESFNAEDTEPPVIVVTEEDEPDEVYKTLKLGAVDFITTPLRPINVVPRVQRFLKHFRQTEAPSNLKHNLIGHSPAFLTEVSKIPVVAKCDAGVMISGETGTGKELCARAIHNMSLRAGKPFIPVNCGAIPVELAENELFGHERGAFTGATTTKPGLIQEADGGTLFLDELDSLPLLAQVKLLRFLQDREYRPLGSTRTRHADVRVVAATNIDFEKAINLGKLRQDLYFRLNIIPISLPPLRDRLEDIQILAEYFLNKYSINFNKHVSGISPNALKQLLRYEWPGNVRELEHVIQRAVALCELSIIRSNDIKLIGMSSNHVFESFKQAKEKVVQQFERNYLQSLLLAYQGNITRAAAAAHKNRRAFWELMRKHDIDVGQFSKGIPVT